MQQVIVNRKTALKITMSFLSPKNCHITRCSFVHKGKQESRNIARRTARCRCKFRYVSKFYNKSIMKRLCTLNTATLSTRAHLAPKPAQNTLNHVKRSFKVKHFGSLKSRRGSALGLLYNNLGCRVGNFEGKV